MYEHRGQPVLPREAFIRRMARHGGYATLLILGSLLLGMAGYRWLAGLSWTAAFLNTAMLLGGMGPVDMPVTDGARLFEGVFALYSGIVFLVVAGLLLVPVFHRVLHRFHAEDGERHERHR